MLPRSRLYTLFKAHGPVHSVVCWHLLVAPHIASPYERLLQMAQTKVAAFAVSFETTHGQAHTIAVRYSIPVLLPYRCLLWHLSALKQLTCYLLFRANCFKYSACGLFREKCREFCPLPLCSLFCSASYCGVRCSGLFAPSASWHSPPSVSGRFCSDRFVLQYGWLCHRDCASQRENCHLERVQWHHALRRHLPLQANKRKRLSGSHCFDIHLAQSGRARLRRCQHPAMACDR